MCSKQPVWHRCLLYYSLIKGIFRQYGDYITVTIFILFYHRTIVCACCGHDCLKITCAHFGSAGDWFRGLIHYGAVLEVFIPGTSERERKMAVLSWVHLCLCCCVFMFLTLPLTSANDDAKRLYHDLLIQNKYNKLIRPVGNNTNKPLTVKMGIRLSQIIDVVSKQLHL